MAIIVNMPTRPMNTQSLSCDGAHVQAQTIAALQVSTNTTWTNQRVPGIRSLISLPCRQKYSRFCPLIKKNGIRYTF